MIKTKIIIIAWIAAQAALIVLKIFGLVHWAVMLIPIWLLLLLIIAGLWVVAGISSVEDFEDY